MEAQKEKKDAEYWKKKAEACFVGSFRHPVYQGFMNGPEKACPARYRKFRMKTRAEFELYMKKCDESEGFDVHGCTGGVCGGIVEIHPSSISTIARAREVAKFAVEYHNEKEKTDLQYWGLVRANGQLVAGFLYYITLRAGNKEGSQWKVYRAKVSQRMTGDLRVESFTVAPDIEQNLEEWLVPVPDCRKQKHRNSRVAPPFVAFVRKLRNKPEFVGVGYRDVLKIASSEWRSMSALDKARFIQEIPINTAYERVKRPCSRKERSRNPKVTIHFLAFMGKLRNKPEFAGMKYVDVLKIAEAKWRSLSGLDKR